jgi:hypothetical protein
MQGGFAGQARREALPSLSASVAAIRETLTGYQTEFLITHYTVCHSETIEPRRSPAHDASYNIIQGK